MGAALTYARRYALFTLVGIAGEDDLDAPDLAAAPKSSTDRPPGPNGRPAPNGHALADAPSAPAGTQRKTPPARPARPLLAADHSAALRDRLVAELDVLQSADEAASWAHRSLPAKNTLTTADAQFVEAGFRARLAVFGHGQPADGRQEAVQGLPEAQPDHSRSNPAAEAPSVAATKVPARVAPAGSGLDTGPPRTVSGDHHHPDGRAGGGDSLGSGIDKSELAFSEPRRVRDKDHRKFVSGQACLICGRQPADAHHLRSAQPRALSRKVSDEFTVPLCRTHHGEVHRGSDEAAWWSGFGVDPYLVAAALWAQSRLGQSVAELPCHPPSAAGQAGAPDPESIAHPPNGPRNRKTKPIAAAGAP
jgi:hypothetical protein